jgi:prepilin-type N-terminal cleavage/methylation domain-containing protein
MNVRQKNKRKEKGFTIIEVVLVLAIAGLIFLMVFIALPALQRSQRDTQRKNDLARVQTAVQNYQSNNRNLLPTFDATFISQYLTVGGDSFSDPDGTAYAFQPGPALTTISFDATKPDMYYTIGASCDGDSVDTGKGTSKVAIQYKLEGGGIACVNN